MTEEKREDDLLEEPKMDEEALPWRAANVPVNLVDKDMQDLVSDAPLETTVEAMRRRVVLFTTLRHGLVQDDNFKTLLTSPAVL